MKSKQMPLMAGGLALLWALLPAPALAQQFINASGNLAWTVYAFGNAQAVADSFRALANFCASSTFQNIVALIALVGVLVVGLSSGFSSAMARKLIGYIVSVFLITYVFFGVSNGGPLSAKVEIYDSVDGTWVSPVTVPAVVGIPAALISTAGYEITRQIEASFAIPDELKLSNGAPFNLAASLISDASQARITDSNLASSLAYYVQDCFTIGVANGTLNAQALLTSTNFLDDIRYDSPSIYVNTLLNPPVGNSDVVSCSQAWHLINNAVNAQGADSASFLKSASAWNRTPAMSVVNSAVDSVAQWSTNSGITDGAAAVKQAAVLGAFSGAFRQAAQQTGNSEFLTGIALTQAHEAQVNSWITGAEVFNRMMGYIFAILQVFVYSITPLVLAAALVPGLGFALLKNFGQILLWLAIWQPMLGIVNFIILSMQQADLGGILNNGFGQYGFTMTNMSVITEKTANMRAAATFVGTMVPALAWAMVKGSVDFSRVIGSAVGENFAQGAANTMTTGNYSLNQASMDSFTANKHSLGQTGDFKDGFVSTGQGNFGQNINQGGVGSEIAAGGGKAALSTAASTALSNSGQLGTSGQTVESLARAQGVANATGVTQANAIGTQGGHTENSGSGTQAYVAGSISPGRGSPAQKPANGLPPGGGPGGTTANQGPDVQLDKKNLLEKAGEAAGAAVRFVNPQVGAQGNVSHGDQYSAGTNASTTQTGSESKTATDNLTAAQNTSMGASAGQTTGYTQSQSMNQTGVASLMDRYAFLQANSAPAASFMAGGANRAPQSDSPIARAAAELSSPGGVHNRVAELENSVQKRMGGYDAAVDAGKSEVATKAAGIERAEDRLANQAKGELGRYASEADRGIVSRGKENILNAAEGAFEGGKELLKKGMDMVTGVGGNKEPSPSAATPGQKRESVQPDNKPGRQDASPHAMAPDNGAHSAAVAAAQAAAQQTPVQMAMAPQQDNPLVPNNSLMQPFSGQQNPDGDASSAMAQAQMSEQQLNRMQNNMRQADGVLASAENRPLEELPDAIREAQNYTRNA